MIYRISLLCCLCFLQLSNAQDGKALSTPNYALLNNWAAHPNKVDPSDSIPNFAKAENRDTVVDVFFVHPTSYLNNLTTKHWNAGVENEKVNNITDKGAILFQASVFNQHARIYAPRYRQAHIKSFFLADNPASPKAIELAYTDVRSAFMFYLEHYNHGRPFIIAAHSQGTLHAIKLMHELIDGEDLQDRMVCAYLVGWAVGKEEFDDIKPCTTATQTGGYVSWRSFKTNEVPKYVKEEQGKAFCINPITWTVNFDHTTATSHKGALGKSLDVVYKNSLELTVKKEYGILWVNPLNELKKQIAKVDNYHFIDYNLFYVDIRQNVDQRVKEFLKKDK